MPLIDTVSSIQELQARLSYQFPERAAAILAQQEDQEKRFQPTFQKFTKQLVETRTKQKEVLKKPTI